LYSTLLYNLLYCTLYSTTNTVYCSEDYNTVQCTIQYTVLCSTASVHHIVYCTLYSVKWVFLAANVLLWILL